MTMRYSHLAPEVARDAVRLLDANEVRGKTVATTAGSVANQLNRNGSAWESNPPCRCSRRASSVLKTEAGTSPARASERVITRAIGSGKTDAPRRRRLPA